MEDTKPIWQSKLNWAGLFSFLIGVAALAGWVPEESVETLTASALTVFGILVPVFRTFATTKRLE